MGSYKTDKHLEVYTQLKVFFVALLKTARHFSIFSTVP